MIVTVLLIVLLSYHIVVCVNYNMLYELFLSGEWQAVEFGLAVIGTLYLGKVIYRVLLERRLSK